MPAVPFVIAGALAVTAYSAVEQGREARRANRAAARAESNRAFRERVQALRTARIAAASGANQAAIGGTLDSSGVQGQIAAVNTNTNANIAFTNQLDSLRQEQLQAQERAARWGMIGNLSGQIAGAASAIAPPAAANIKPQPGGTEFVGPPSPR